MYFTTGTKASDYITNLAKTDTTNLANDNTSDKNLRYIGSNPNNYVLFNNELWRIIGVMNNIKSSKDGVGEKRVKIIRNDILPIGLMWDSSSNDINGGRGINEWSYADLKIILNENYLGKINGGVCYKDLNNVATDCPDWSAIGLNEYAKSLISTALWTTGIFKTLTQSEWTAYNAYVAEQSTNNGKICSFSNACNDGVVRTTDWLGIVGLMYPSDYGYAVGGNVRSTCLNLSMYNYGYYGSDNCFSYNWLHLNDYSQYTITPCPFSSGSSGIFAVYSNGTLYYYDAVGIPVRPVVYLKSSVKITGGTGSSSSPYTLGL